MRRATATRVLFAAMMIIAMVALPLYAAEGDKASISFGEKVYNFGNIREDGGPVSCEFEFVNTGSSNLVVISATAECGCTTPEFPKQPIAPGKKGKIKVTYNPLGRPGGFDKVVTV